MRDTIYRDEAIGAVAHEYGAKHIRSVGETVADILQALKTLPSADVVSREDYHNLLMAFFC
jgi:hypothetical protein